MVASVDSVGVALEEFIDRCAVMSSDECEELGELRNVSLLGPFAGVDGTEASSHALATGIVQDKCHAASDKLFLLLFEKGFLLVRDRKAAVLSQKKR